MTSLKIKIYSEISTLKSDRFSSKTDLKTFQKTFKTNTNIKFQFKHQRFASRINVQTQKSLSFFSKDEIHTIHRNTFNRYHFSRKTKLIQFIEIHSIAITFFEKRNSYSSSKYIQSLSFFSKDEIHTIHRKYIRTKKIL